MAFNPKLTTQQFIEKAVKKHDGRYLYFKSKYTVGRNKIIITCPNHGDFELVAKKHPEGVGCNFCFRERQAKKFTLTQDEFLKRAKKVHGDKYYYHKAFYKSIFDKVDIICKNHDVFKIAPNDFFKGSGCPKCALEKTAKDQRLTQKEFIKRFLR